MENKYLQVPAGAMILGENQYYSQDSFQTQLNNNVVVVGASGAGKTRYIVKPNILQAWGSYVISDPKGSLYKEMAPYLKSKGYNVVKMDFIHPEKSLRYNPLAYCKTTNDIRRLAHTLVYEMSQTKNANSSKDPFWDETAEILMCALIGYIVESDQIPERDKNLVTLNELIVDCKRTRRSTAAEHGASVMDEKMEKHKMSMRLKGQESWAAARYDQYNTSPDKTHETINICTVAKLGTFDTLETRKMLKGNDIVFSRIGTEPTALFVEVSDTDRSMDILVNLFYSQLMNGLCSFADEKCPGNCLPIPVRFILDDFATNARIDNFQNIISNIRSRGISAMLMVQSEAQLKSGYKEDAQTIVDNCNTYVYMGGSNPEQAEGIAKRANKPAHKILNMPIGTSWIFRRGQEPILCRNFDLEWFMKEKEFVKPREKKKPNMVIVMNEENSLLK